MGGGERISDCERAKKLKLEPSLSRVIFFSGCGALSKALNLQILSVSLGATSIHSIQGRCSFEIVAAFCVIKERSKLEGEGREFFILTWLRS